MKSVLFAALLATLTPAHAANLGTTDQCDIRPYVGVCPDACAKAEDNAKAEALMAAVSPSLAQGINCNIHPYVGVCDDGEDS